MVTALEEAIDWKGRHRDQLVMSPWDMGRSGTKERCWEEFLEEGNLGDQAWKLNQSLSGKAGTILIFREL